MLYWKLKRYFAEDDGANGGGEATTPEQSIADTGTEEPVFTPEQQAKIDAMIDKAFARGAARASKAAKSEAEKTRLKVQTALAKEGYAVGDETDSALVGLLAAAPDALESNLAALQKLIDAKVNQEVDKRLKSVGSPAPKSGKDDVTVGDTINGLFRKIR